MPELPEVETIRQDLLKKLINKKIARVVVYKPMSVANQKAAFIKALQDNAITNIERRGKLLVWSLKFPTVIPSEPRGDEGSLSVVGEPEISHPLRRGIRNDKSVALLVHLKMTGQLIYIKMSFPRKRESSGDGSPIKSGMTVVAGGHKLSEKDIDTLPNKWTRIVFVFADGGELFFNDLRLFGYMKLATQSEVDAALKKYGPEPPLTLPSPVGRGGDSPLLAGEGRRVRSRSQDAGKDFTLSYFSSLFKKRKNTNLKALLLNQELIAGLGNIYVDEVCFVAGVKPTRRVGSITKAEQQKLFHAIPKILTEALKHRGTTFRNFLDSSGKKGNYTDFLMVYDRDGQPCKRCGKIILKTKAAGRGTHFCPKCQK
ncbi:MAG: hypothetical protein EXS55_01975 [Candidatus Magasanikbacteria bacterium]|nr:hypothetical protein [Candidatus Magasanikbacteria bacterium]